jgi:DNA-binding CsgD family transcriptional regulator
MLKLNQPIEASEPRLRGTSRPRAAPAELLVITLRVARKSLEEIAIELNLARATVETQMSNLYRRMGCTSIVDPVHFALAHRLLEKKYAPLANREEQAATTGRQFIRIRIAARIASRAAGSAGSCKLRNCSATG